MVQVSRRTFAVTPEGVGRPDYSMNVEMSVEPQIRSYQAEYKAFEEIVLAAGASETQEIDITERTVVMVYDFYLSPPSNAMLPLNVEFFSKVGTWEEMADKSALQTVEVHYTRGFPLFDKYRITVTNYGDNPIDALFSAHGVVTDEEIYYGELIQ